MYARPVSTPARIFLVDDHPVFRLGLAALIRSEDGIELVGEAATIRESMAVLRTIDVDLVVVDLSLEDGSGLDLIKRLKAELPRMRALVVSMHDENLFADRALRAGAAGYLSKDIDPSELIAGIRKALAGEVVLSSAMTSKLLMRAVHGVEVGPVSPITALSDRELEIYELIGQGKTTRDIASALHISIKTVETHQANIKAKLGVKNANELLRSAVTWVARLDS
jgi:DNA-binding NarL/FixJ family response regulator